jgi:hypothetical protein
MYLQFLACLHRQNLCLSCQEIYSFWVYACNDAHLLGCESVSLDRALIFWTAENWRWRHCVPVKNQEIPRDTASHHTRLESWTTSLWELKSYMARMTSKNSFLTSTLPLLHSYSLLYVLSYVSTPLLYRHGLFINNDSFLLGILYKVKENVCFGDLFVSEPQ